ncbi:MAG: glycosyltransferase [Pirellula sp.]|jgi:GT2 family glycosyltransferase|nr:glycosyltransferase [Pirellula sp.]
MIESSTPSIIIPVLNNPQGLRRCIEALRGQGIAFELIVVDNGSTDETCAVAELLADRVLIYPKLTVGALRNQGAQVAKGQILVFTDSDQRPAEGWLASGLEALAREESAGMVGARYHAPEGSSWVAKTLDLQRRYSDVRGDIGWLQGGNLFVKRAAFERVGGFRTDLVASEDVDLSFRVRKAGFRVICDPKIINYHDGDPQTLIDFFRKERWRGSSGWKAWATQGYPLSELPSLLWPFWVVLGLVGVALGASLGTWMLGMVQGITISLLLLIGLVSPSIYRAVSIYRRLNASPIDGIRMLILLVVYGLARFPLGKPR